MTELTHDTTAPTNFVDPPTNRASCRAGNCPRCGAPVWVPAHVVQVGDRHQICPNIPFTVIYTCDCKSRLDHHLDLEDRYLAHTLEDRDRD